MIDYFSDRLSNALVYYKLIGAQEIDEYKYALICNIESFVSFGSIIILSLVFQSFIPTLFFLVSFITIRNRSGGFHFDSFIKCYVGTILIYACVIYIGSLNFGIRPFNILVALASVSLLLIGAVNHPNMNYSSEEYSATKESTRLVVVLLDVVIIIMNYIRFPKKMVIYMEMGIIISAILLMLSKLLKQEVKEDG